MSWLIPNEPCELLNHRNQLHDGLLLVEGDFDGRDILCDLPGYHRSGHRCHPIKQFVATQFHLVSPVRRHRFHQEFLAVTVLPVLSVVRQPTGHGQVGRLPTLLLPFLYV